MASAPLSPGAHAALTADQSPGVVAVPGRLHAWASAARAGDRFVYATLCRLPPRAAGAAYLRLLAARGLVQLTQRRVSRDRPGLPGVWSYLATRTAMPWPARVAAPGGVDFDIGGAVASVEALAVDQLLPVLTRAAQFRRPCPTDRQLAERVGCSPADVAAAMQRLKDLRLIATRWAPGATSRVVTILANGAATGMAA